MEVGKVYKFKINNYDMNGLGVSKLDGIVVFVERALEGEVVMAEITNVHKKFAFAKTVRILEPNINRLAPVCPYYELCGGCDLLHMDYQTECKIKEQKVRDAFKKINRINDFKLNPILRSKHLLGYRNKVMVPFGKDDDDNVIYGFYKKQSHDIVSIDRCEISNHYANEVVEFIRRYVSVMNVPIYNEETHEGILRVVMTRNNFKNELMVVLVVMEYYDFSRLIEYISGNFSYVKSIYLNINNEKTNVMLSNNYIHLYGDQWIVEEILGTKFRVSAGAFLQVNHDQCQKLYLEALNMADLTLEMNVIDAYCGMGSITLNIAKRVNHVYGIEIVEEAIENANYNKELNQISNATFICGKCEEVIINLVGKEKIDVIFFDPPRKGCDQKFLETICSMKIKKIVYISCNIATACRDINYLTEHGYEVKEITPVDMFSKTSHVESVVLLELKNRP